jgi:dTDP-glucose pyrophosphorylase
MENPTPKPLLMVGGKSILSHIVYFWLAQGVSKFIFVVGYRKELVIEHIGKLNLSDYKIVFQDEQKGIANAIMQVKNHVFDKFIVALGDCLHIGVFEYPKYMDQGYGILDNYYKNAQSQGCNVIVVNNEIVAVYEKPPMDYAGIGTYFFDHRVFNYIQNTKPNKERNEIDIADVMTNMVKDGQHIKAVPFRGRFTNCTYPGDIELAKELIK